MQLSIGTTLQSGKYKIISVLGQGGFGITYLAQNTLTNISVAIKEFFPKDFCGRDNTSHLTIGTQNNAQTVEKLKKRFLKEAKNISKLNHPGIVKIYEVFEENETAYYVMDFIEGQNLNEIVKNRGALPEEKAIEYITKIADALSYIHSKNMTHFDVKPANIVVRKSDDSPVLIDFGLSKQYDQHGDATSTVMQGISQGYSPIELYNAGSVETFSPQTDIYSLGATLFYLLTATTPPPASQLIEEGLTLPENINPKTGNTIKRAMSANRTKRYKSIKNFCKSLPTSELKPENDKIINSNPETDTIKQPDTNSETLLLNSDSTSNFQTSEIISSDQDNTEDYNQGELYEEEQPSLWSKFLNWICGTSNLINGYQIPNKKKIQFFLFLCFLLISTSILPIIGWIIYVFSWKNIVYSSQRLFFPEYLNELDDAFDYSKRKAIIIVSLVIVIPLTIFCISYSLIKSQKEKELNENITTISTYCPINMFDTQISTVSNINGEITFTCISLDTINSNRNYLNTLNLEMILPDLVNDSLPFYKIVKDNPITFKFFNNKKPINDIVLTPEDFNNYKGLSTQEKGKRWLQSYLELENTYLPYNYGENIQLTKVILDEIASKNDQQIYLKYVFEDPNNNLNKQFGDSINYKIAQLLPLKFSYLVSSAMVSAAGIGYGVFNKSSQNPGLTQYGYYDDVLYTSEEIRQLLGQ